MTSCRVCGVAATPRPGRPREATVGSVAAVAETMTVVPCPDGHDAPPAVEDAAHAAVVAALPQATRRLLARGDRCGRCDAPLTMPVRRTERPVTLIEVDPLPVTTVRFDLPTVRCTECGLDQVPTRSQDDLRRAVAALFAP